jgi:hypothetical protein
VERLKNSIGRGRDLTTEITEYTEILMRLIGKALDAAMLEHFYIEVKE